MKGSHYGAFAFICAMLFATSAFAANDELAEYQRRVKKAEVMGALGADMFGDSVNYYNGATSFAVTDIDIPGNNSLPVRVGRMFSASHSDDLAASGAFGDWEADIPHMKGTFATGYAWQVAGASPDSRCSSGGQVPVAVQYGGRTFTGNQYWGGNTLYVPGAGTQSILRPTQPTSLPKPADGLTKFYTSKFWQIRCGVSLANGTGEGFLALAPDGTKYTFDWMTTRNVEGLLINNGPGVPSPVLPRVDVRIYPTRIEDRFGNWVQYVWSGAQSASQLTQITSSDGRVIKLCYTSGRVSAAGVGVTDSCGAQTGSRLWTYEYAVSGSKLKRVALPDATTWVYRSSESVPLGSPDGLPSFKIIYDASSPIKGNCNRPGTWLGSTARTLVINHPGGATGVFGISAVRHGRTRVVNVCPANGVDEGNPYGWHSYGPPVNSDNFALNSKEIKGASLNSQVWTVAYALSAGCSELQGSCDPNAVPDLRDVETVTVTNPDSTRTKHTFGVRHWIDEGKLLLSEVLPPTGAALQSTRSTYLINSSYPSYGDTALNPVPTESFEYFAGYSDVEWPDDFAESRLVPLARTTITREISTYTKVVNSFDAFARPVGITRSNDIIGSPMRSEVVTYRDFTGAPGDALWVLGQAAQTCIAPVSGLATAVACQAAAGSVIASSQDFYAATALPWHTYAFGQLQGTSTYNADGTLATRTDATNNQTQVGNWKRGIPQALTFADNTTASAVVDDNGWIKSITDENGATFGYDYDVMGRLILVTYPTGDLQAWVPKVLTHQVLGASELGIPAGSWRTRITEANLQRSVYFDARFNPVLEEEKDTTTGIAHYTRREFDYEGKATYQSYPSATSAASAGVVITVDELGRPTKKQVRTNGTLGLVLEQVEYLAGNKRKVTDADFKATTITYQAFDTPGYDRPVKVEAPENQTTEILRDFLGKMNSVTQSGLGFTATRSFTYDSSQQLCSRNDPESKFTLFGYDAAGRVKWEFKGQNAGGCLASLPVPTGATEFIYDARGRASMIDHPGTADDVSYTYWDNGATRTVTNTTAVWTYTYNKRNLLETELALVDGLPFLLDPSYDTAGRLTSLLTPSGRSIAYSPDAWGRPTQAGSFATGVQYHPNGLVSGYGLGNGLAYTQTLNARLWPEIQQTMQGITKVQKFIYTYSDAGDVKVIVDDTDGADSATLDYDDLHRLETATGMWGTYTYGYDTLNNLKSRTGGAGDLTYTYEAVTNRLKTITGAQSRTFAYNDPRDPGWITADGIRSFTLNASGQITSAAGATYAYDGNGKRIKATQANGTIEYALYNAAGALVYTQRVALSPPAVTRTDYVMLAGKVIAKVENSGAADTTTYLHADLLGSPRKATYGSGPLVGQEQWREHYDPWGMKLNGVNEKIGYTGHPYDAETALTYMQARFYDPLVGRFLSTDPIYFSDQNPFTFNRYAYANNNPYRYTDPTGLASDDSNKQTPPDTKPGDCEGSRQSAACSGAGTAANDPSLHTSEAIAAKKANQAAGGGGSKAQGTAPAQEEQPQGRFENQTDMSKFVDDHKKAGLGYYVNYVDEIPIPKKGEDPSGAGTQTVIGIVDRNGNVIREGRFDSATGRLTGGGARLPEGPIPLSDWMESRGF
jgi:RHS repeat-associated protein